MSSIVVSFKKFNWIRNSANCHLIITLPLIVSQEDRVLYLLEPWCEIYILSHNSGECNTKFKFYTSIRINITSIFFYA